MRHRPFQLTKITVGQRFIIGSEGGGGFCFYQKLSISIYIVVLNERKSLSVSDAYKWRCIGSVSRGFHLW